MATCCPCDVRPFPPEPRIPAGLSSLPRQVLGFPDYRRAMLATIRAHEALDAWRAREGDDLGLMLLEWWAYVGDVLAFYDQQIAEEAYLRTADRPASLRRLVALIGYRPRPAIAAEALIAAIADGKEDVLVPAFTGFRSQAFGQEPPQVFESIADVTISPRRNEWTVAPIKSATAQAGGPLLFDPRELRLTRGAMALVQWGTTRIAARIDGITTTGALDGATYAMVDTTPRVELPAGQPFSDITIAMATATAGVNRLVSSPLDAAGTGLTLDAIYPQFVAGTPVILGRGTALLVRDVTAVAVAAVTPSSPSLPAMPATTLTLSPALSGDWVSESSRITVHFQLAGGGRLTRPAETGLTRATLAPAAALAGLSPPLAIPAHGPLLAEDADERGLLLDGTVSVAADGRGTLALATAGRAFTAPLVPPVTVFGNVIPIVRGETVAHEVLGSGDATQAFQSFTLAKKPLTYVTAPSAPSGRRSTLTVRADGIRWQEVESFFGSGPTDQVYIVRQDDEGTSIVTFGDGRTGARLPSGVDNVTARYRHGAGAAKPPAHGITQLARPVKGMRRVLNPVAASGGADADKPGEIRRNAPASALTLGRAVSLADFEAIARGFPGVVNAAASWAWDASQQRAVVTLRFIGDGGDVTAALLQRLRAQSDPHVPIDAAAATAVVTRLCVDLVVDERFEATDVRAAVIAALTERERGLLAHENVPIGGAIFRSAIFAAVQRVPGVAAIRGMTVNGVAAPVAIVVPDGAYPDFLPFTNE